MKALSRGFPKLPKLPMLPIILPVMPYHSVAFLVNFLVGMVLHRECPFVPSKLIRLN